jgi:hypothetical protein
MKTVHLTDEAFAEIATALEEKGRGMEMAIDLLVARRGLDSQDVAEEVENFRRLGQAVLEYHDISNWRRNPSARTLPPGSVFEPLVP